MQLLADGDTLKWSVEELQLASFSAPEVPASLSGGAVLKITFGKMDVWIRLSTLDVSSHFIRSYIEYMFHACQRYLLLEP